MCITSFSFSGVTVQRLFVAASAGVAPAALGDAFVVTAAHVGIASLASPVELRVSVTAVHPPSRAYRRKDGSRFREGRHPRSTLQREQHQMGV